MNEKDVRVHKVLAELGIDNQPDLTPEQEEVLKTALDPEEQFLSDVERLFKPNNQ